MRLFYTLISTRQLAAAGVCVWERERESACVCKRCFGSCLIIWFVGELHFGLTPCAVVGCGMCLWLAVNGGHYSVQFNSNYALGSHPDARCGGGGGS